MTNGWIDIKNTDMMLIMGGNPAENHPCGFKWAIEAKIHRNAKTIVVDPRLTRTAANADMYVQIRAGADIAFLMNPCRMAQVRDIAFAGEVMPQKSTDFYPKLLSGLTVYALD